MERYATGLCGSPAFVTTLVFHFLIWDCASSSSKSDPELTLAVLCDLSKAFDVVDHKILLKKMGKYGIRGIANDWFRNYLSDRTQFVEINGIQSQKVAIQIGVPQG